MTVEEIFNKIAVHMRKGLDIHEQLVFIYNFLNLKGYKKCHEYHFFEETHAYRYLIDFYFDTYHKLISFDNLEKTQLIPATWYKHTKEDVDTSTKRNGVKEAMRHWVEWEKEAKKLWEESYQQLCELNEIYAAAKIMDFLKNTSEELNYAEAKQNCLESANYDMIYILDEQDFIYEKYKEKMRCIFDD